MHPLLVEGLSDAVGFVGGALAGFWLARLLGFDPFAEGYDGASVLAIAAVGRGGGEIDVRWTARAVRSDERSLRMCSGRAMPLALHGRTASVRHDENQCLYLSERERGRVYRPIAESQRHSVRRLRIPQTPFDRRRRLHG